MVRPTLPKPPATATTDIFVCVILSRFLDALFMEGVQNQKVQYRPTNGHDFRVHHLYTRK